MRVDFCVLEIMDPVNDLSIFPQHLFRDSRSLLLPISKLMDPVILPIWDIPFFTFVEAG